MKRDLNEEGWASLHRQLLQNLQQRSRERGKPFVQRENARPLLTNTLQTSAREKSAAACYLWEKVPLISF